jgi:Asp-tRNA(Asn)/Glu-tRNA(Gln) amidotransferase A subunit family amidase
MMTDMTEPSSNKVDNVSSASISEQDLMAAERLVGLGFTTAEHSLMAEGVFANQRLYEKLRGVLLPNSVPPAYSFDPRLPRTVSDAAQAPDRTIALQPDTVPPLPADLDDVAFWPVTWLARLIESRQVTSLALTQMYLARLKRYDPVLHCVITLTEERALKAAQRADHEIAAGKYRGPLHGIPWGVKDLLATNGDPTTWGSPIFKEQYFDYDATVIERLDAAGAVLVAKLAVGELAMDDVWFGGMTRTPWDVTQGSSGSSAGSASAVAAGLVGFAIGTETYGSIVSPANRCRITGLRPTFGRISRHGAMMLCWTMDKVGPMARSVEDCALVFNAIYGADGKDGSVVDAPFRWPPDKSARTLRIGYVPGAFEIDDEYAARSRAALDVFKELHIELLPVTLPRIPIDAMELIVYAEAAASFDELTRDSLDDLMVRQGKNDWPNVFRFARLIPAVEYIQAQRLRTLAMQAMAEIMSAVDVYIVPHSDGDNLHNLLLTNLTGHPAVVIPNGVTESGKPSSLTFIGGLYRETDTLAVAQLYQAATDFHLRKPPLPVDV